MKSGFLLFALILVVLVFGCVQVQEGLDQGTGGLGEEIKLPEPDYQGIAVEEAIKSRRSRRSYSNESLSLGELSQLLWAAQGITSGYKRAAPSAGATYPLEIYVVAGDVEGLEPGVYHYIPSDHSIKMVSSGDKRSDLARSAMDQVWIQNAPAGLVFTAVYERTTGKYGERGIMYVHIEAGHAAQNVYLQSESLNLASVFVGAFSDDMVKQVLGIKNEPLGIMPIGHRVD
ncbi:MAG: SagB/ThcOx family dehydrogenase [Candidatus Aenigmatarchaeota archaeon]|nr:MAG: SagB/ThcOx family dehydrogenase [Candidatus Aenigmarchaeota archaeon]